MNASRLAVAAAAFSAVAIVACSATPIDDSPNVEVKQGTVDPTCVRGGPTCGVTGASSSGSVLDPGTSSGSTSGSSGRFPGLVSSSGFVLDPGTGSSSSGGTSGSTPPRGVDPLSCGECISLYDEDGVLYGCDCRGAGNGLQSGIVCPVSAPCRYLVHGSYRCYRYDYPSNTCH